MGNLSRRGFTLVELAIVVTIIGILAALAIPLFQHIVRKSRLGSLSSDLRTHADAIQRSIMEEGSYPSSSGVGELIPGAELYLSRSWLQPTPIGGGYTWKTTAGSGDSVGSAYIEIVETSEAPFSVKLSDLEKLDEDFDDGNVGSGFLQVTAGGVRYFIVLPAD